MCLCFHVTLRMLYRHVVLASPTVVAQMSDCYNAGTGCGWCRPQLARIFAEVKAMPERFPDMGITAEEYRRARAAYRGESAKKAPPPSDGMAPLVEDLLE